MRLNVFISRHLLSRTVFSFTHWEVRIQLLTGFGDTSVTRNRPFRNWKFAQTSQIFTTIKARWRTLTPTRCDQYITHAQNHFTRSVSSHGQLLRLFGRLRPLKLSNFSYDFCNIRKNICIRKNRQTKWFSLHVCPNSMSMTGFSSCTKSDKFFK